MALLERVSTLIRANLNDIVDRAEDPEKMLKQIILDMQNQLLQVKTQVAIAMADEQLLEKKRIEHEEKAVDWNRKAELAVDKNDDGLARAALERALNASQLSRSFAEQIGDQNVQVENLKAAFHKLESKLAEARAKSEILVARQRRSRALRKAGQASLAGGDAASQGFDRMKDKVMREEAEGNAFAQIARDDVEGRLEALERDDKIDQLLAELKARKGAGV